MTALEIGELLSIRYVKLHMTFMMTGDASLPADKVSALRGGMGEMLLRSNCVRDRECGNCDFEEECVVRRTMYSRYEKPPRFVTTNGSVGYLIECEDHCETFLEGDCLQMTLILFGKSIAYFNQYLQAFFALGIEGIGRDHARYRIASVTNTKGRPLLVGGTVYMENYEVQTITEYVRYRLGRMSGGDRQVRLVFHEPAALKYQGAFLEEYRMDAIWQAVLRRIYMLECFEGLPHSVYDKEELKEIAMPEIVEQRAHHVGIRRYSSTQERKMTLNGIKGYLQLDRMPEEMLPFLLAGELIHIGKNTSFGFGRYLVQ